MKKTLSILFIALAFSFFANAQITGPSNICIATAVAFSDASTGGTWSSSNTAVAIAGSSNGYISGMAIGVATITYTLAGVTTTKSVTVNQSPGPITGIITLCGIGASVTLADAVSGGLWTSGNTLVATIASASGVATGVSGGSANISYTLPSGCRSTSYLNVRTVAQLIGCDNIGVGDTLTFPEAHGLYSSNFSVAATSLFGTVVAGVSPGTATIFLYSPTTGCIAATRNITVTPTTLIKSITGSVPICAGTTIALSDPTTGGTWSMSSTAVATINAAGVAAGITGGETIVSYSVPGATCTMLFWVNSLPHPLTGPTHICMGDTIELTTSAGLYRTNSFYGDWYGIDPFLIDGPPDYGGIFSSSDTNKVKLASYPCGTCYFTYLAAASPGTSVITFRDYTTGCTTSTTVTVNPTAPITGPDFFTCPGGAPITYSDSIGGGKWSVSNISVATIDSVTGVLSSSSLGIDTISYRLASGCSVSKIATDFLPALSMSGPNPVCAGTTETLGWYTGSTWSSSATSIATINATTGAITGVAAGTTTVTISMGPGCSISVPFTVNPLPIAGIIIGSSTVCAAATTPLTETVTGGTWSNATTGIATIGSTGIVSGIAAGTSTVLYSVTNSCGTVAATKLLTVNPLPVAGTITGNLTVCATATDTLTDFASGGTWSSSATGIAIAGTTGIVTGISAGTSAISYIVTNGCGTAMATISITVNPLPVAGMITAPAVVCPGIVDTLIETIIGGTWGSSELSVASVAGATGVLTGAGSGSTVIIYTVTNSCGSATAYDTITVHPLPFAGVISGSVFVCNGSAIILTDTTAGGMWASSNTTATVAGGTVTGVTPGVDTITYTVTNVCGYATAVTTLTVGALPIPETLTGGGSYCSSDTGVHIGLGGSEIIAFYQLYTGIVPIGIPVTGTGAAIDFGLFTVPGTYTVTATTTTTGCNNDMAGSETITVTATTTPTIAVTASPGTHITIGAVDTFSAATSGAGTSPTYQWYKNSMIIPGATDSIYIGSGFFDGDSVSCEVLSSAPCGTFASALVIITLDVAGVRSVNEQQKFLIYPNPNNGVFVANLLSAVNEPVHLVITNIVGEKVLDVTSISNHATGIKLNDAGGVYFITASTAAGNNFVKVVCNH